MEQIQALEDRWLEVYLAGDVDGFADLLDDDFVYSSERGVFHKTQYVANLASGTIKMDSLKNTEIHSYLHGDTCVSIGVVSMQATFQGKDISGNDRFTRVWRKKGDTYKAIALHANQKQD